MREVTQGRYGGWVDADPDTDPDPAFFLIADPDSRIPDPDPGFDDLKLKNITAEK